MMLRSPKSGNMRRSKKRVTEKNLDDNEALKAKREVEETEKTKDEDWVPESCLKNEAGPTIKEKSRTGSLKTVVDKIVKLLRDSKPKPKKKRLTKRKESAESSKRRGESSFQEDYLEGLFDDMEDEAHEFSVVNFRKSEETTYDHDAHSELEPHVPQTIDRNFINSLEAKKSISLKSLLAVETSV